VIRYCYTHRIGWFMHENDETCNDQHPSFPKTPVAKLPEKLTALKKRRAKNKRARQARNKNR
jgi:hypothetical protein